MTNPKQDPFVYEKDRYEGMLEQAVQADMLCQSKQMTL